MTNEPRRRVAELHTRANGETKDGLPVHELVPGPAGDDIAKALAGGGAPVVQVDVSTETQATIGRLVVENMQLHKAAQQLYARAEKAEAERDQLQHRLDLLGSDGR